MIKFTNCLFHLYFKDLTLFTIDCSLKGCQVNMTMLDCCQSLLHVNHDIHLNLFLLGLITSAGCCFKKKQIKLQNNCASHCFLRGKLITNHEMNNDIMNNKQSSS